MTVATRMIRVLKIERNGFAEESKERTTRVIWEGDDVIALSEQYPPSDIMGADRLGFASIEDGWITWHYEFQEFSGGDWVTCPDPRRRLDPELTDLEYEIDRENRRLFPGDYAGNDDDEYPVDWDPHEDEEYLDDEDYYRAHDDFQDGGQTEGWWEPDDEDEEDTKQAMLEAKLYYEAMNFVWQMREYLNRKYYLARFRNY